MGEKVILLDQFVSMFGMRARIALAAKGVVYDYREQDLFNKSQLLLQSNPIHKQIPILIQNDKPVCESLIILEYIDEVWNQGYPLLPPHPYQRAQARFWVDYIDKQFYGTGRKIWCTSSEEELEAGKKELVETLKQLESQLGEEAFFGGERLGFLDVVLVPYSTCFHTYKMCSGFSIREHCPKLTQCVKRCIDFVSESLADPAKIYDFVSVMRKVLGLHTL
ncbi:probable glutathione S-transferase parA [Salvia hispanica]|uniref:probable glutathione S-transferase parA n=1 Tax=Salvia hispanica TaxID=49212 RepID=UPI002009AD22|nr:probable glutathione S-transferase parA [Salvia hispanica]